MKATTSDHNKRNNIPASSLKSKAPEKVVNTLLFLNDDMTLQNGQQGQPHSLLWQYKTLVTLINVCENNYIHIR